MWRIRERERLGERGQDGAESGFFSGRLRFSRLGWIIEVEVGWCGRKIFEFGKKIIVIGGFDD